MVRWNPKTNEKKIIEIYQDGYKKQPLAYVGILYCDDKIILFPTEDEKTKVVNEKGVLVAEGKYSIAEEKDHSFICFRKDLCELNIMERSGEKKITVNTIINRCDFDFERLIKENKYIMQEQMELNIIQMIELLPK